MPSQKNITSLDRQLAKITQNLDNPKAKKPNVGKRITISGLINADLRYQTKPKFKNKKSAKLALAQTKLNIDVLANDWISGHVGVFFAGRPEYYYPNAVTSTNVDLDEVYATIANLKKSPFYFRVGRQYLPFGEYHRYPVLKSLTQSLSETRATALQLGFVHQSGMYAAIYIFNGSAKRMHKKRSMNNHGLVFGFARRNKPVNFDISIDYLNNMADVGAIRENLMVSRYTRRIGAFGVNGSINSGPFDFEVHYVSALRTFSPNDF